MNGDIIISQASQKKSKWPIVLLLSVVAFAVIAVLVIIFLKPSNNSVDSAQEQKTTLNELLDSSYKSVNSVQKTYLNALDGKYQNATAFTEQTKNGIKDLYEKLSDFNNSLRNIDISAIDNQFVSTNISLLTNTIDSDLVVWDNTVTLYNLVYDCIGNNFDKKTCSKIEEINEDGIDLILEWINLFKKEDESSQDSNILQMIFSVYADDNFGNVQYYQVIGDIIPKLHSENDQ